MTDSLERNARTVSLLTLVSRVAGLLRDAALSRVFGAGPLMSAFFFAFLVPNLFRRLFGEGALSAAFLPGYAKLHQSDPATARAFASLTVARLVVVLGLVTIVGELVLMAMAGLGDTNNPAVVFLMIMLPYMPLVCLVAILGAMLQVHGRFGPTAAAPIILNICLIIAIVVLHPLFVRQDQAGPVDVDTLLSMRYQHLCWVGVALVVAGIIQVLWSLAAIKRVSGRWWVGASKQKTAAAPFRNMLLMAGPMILSLGVLQLNTFLDGLIASYPVTFGTSEIMGHAYPIDDSGMAVLSFGQRLYQFPLGVFGIAIATAIFPLLARQTDDNIAFVDTLRRGLRLVIFIGLPASVGLILVRDQLASVIFEGGEFGREDTARVGLVLLGYAPAIWAYSMTHTLTRAFYAREDSKRPMRVALGIVSLNIVLNLTLIWWLAEAGLAWSTAICAIVQAIILLRLVRTHTGPIVNTDLVGSWMKSLLATGLMAGGVFGITQVLPEAETWWGELGVLATLVAVGGGVMGLAAFVLRMPELWWATGRRSAAAE